jgi:hypothetical protein
VFHTAGEPPNSGNTMRANIGCTRNNNVALTKIVAVKANTSRRFAATDFWFSSVSLTGCERGASTS